MGVSVMIYDSHLLPVKTLLYPLFIHVALVDVTYFLIHVFVSTNCMMYCKSIICYNYYVDCSVLLFFFMIKSIFDLLLLFSKITVDKKNT